MSLSLRTSNSFSKRIELGGRIAYGFGDEKFKYGATFRYNITPKKRGLLTTYYNYDIEQIGLSSSALSMGNTFTTILSTAPFDKLTFVTKAGFNFEKDIKKDFVAFTGIIKKSSMETLYQYQQLKRQKLQQEFVGLKMKNLFQEVLIEQPQLAQILSYPFKGFLVLKVYSGVNIPIKNMSFN